MKNYILPLICFFLFSLNINAQSDISSPYSMYGIGKVSPNYFAGLSAMGNTGIAYSTAFNINKTNPASLTSIPKSSFLYEVGFNNTFSTKKTNNINQQNFDFSFTHIAMGLTINDYWSTSFGILPYSKVNYEIDVLQPVEGTTASYNTNVTGSGGITEVFWANGFKLSNNFSVGLEIAGKFGSIDQEQYINLGATSAYIKKSTNYFSASLNTGFQYKLNDLLGHNTTLGATITTPSTYSGAETLEGSKTLANLGEIPISFEFDDDPQDIETPFKLGIGLTTNLNKNLLVNIDFRKNYWGSTNKTFSTVSYVDQTIYALGVEFKPSTEYSNYWNKVKYRAGINYDSGYLNLSNNDIDSYTFSLGLGMPISKNGLSTMNINYSYGKEGTINNELVQDNFHKLSLNLSLFGNWFKKQKIF